MQKKNKTMKFFEQRVDITNWKMKDLEKMDLEKVERIERTGGQVIAIVRSD